MRTRVFLIFCAVGLVPIALGYGAKPSVSLDALFGMPHWLLVVYAILEIVLGLVAVMLYKGRKSAAS